MKKIITITLITLATATHAAPGFKSTQDAMNAIFNAFNPLLQTPNIFDQKVSFGELAELGAQLNTHIMKKQGILVGSKSKRDRFRFLQGDCDVPNNTIHFKDINFKRCTNLFDFWDLYVYPQFTQLINRIMNYTKVARITGSADKYPFYEEINIFDGLLLPHIKKIRDDSILADKKKVADIMIFFIEHIIELINKAVEDIKNLK